MDKSTYKLSTVTQDAEGVYFLPLTLHMTLTARFSHLYISSPLLVHSVEKQFNY